nr:EOG090X0JXR [Ilyocryptus agilis]
MSAKTKMWSLSRQIVFCCLFAFIGSTELDSDASSVIFLSHSFGYHPMEIRGQINIRSLKSGSVTIQQDSSTLEYKDFKAAAKVGEFYHLQATVKYNGIERQFLTSTKACLLFESRLSDIITVHVDLLGNIYGISLATSQSQCGQEIPEFEPNFNTTVLISYMEHGPIPDVAMYVQKMEQEKIAKERGETKDNRSFIAKYWMYILPLVLVFMISGASNPEQANR